MVRKSRPVDVVKSAGTIKLGDVGSPADVPYPEENFKVLGLHEGPMNIDNFIRWVEDARKYRRGYFHIFDSSVEILK